MPEAGITPRSPARSIPRETLVELNRLGSSGEGRGNMVSLSEILKGEGVEGIKAFWFTFC